MGKKWSVFGRIGELDLNKEIFDTLSAFTNKKEQGAYAYCLAMENNGEVTFHERLKQPCYGEMRIYNPEGWKPSDLHTPFPEGNPVGVSVNLHYWKPQFALADKAGVFSEESLWWPLLKDRFVKTDNDDGFVMTDCDFDSDYWFGFLLSIRRMEDNVLRYDQYRKADVAPITAWVAAMQTMMQGSAVLFNPSNMYNMAYPCSFKNLLNRTPLSFQGGTFHERKTLREMPDNMASRIWGGTDKFTDYNGQRQMPLDQFLKEVLPWLEMKK